jgi:hypothetical protein
LVCGYFTASPIVSVSPAQHLIPRVKKILDKILDKYLKEHNICIQSLLVFAAGQWDKLIHWCKTKEEDVSQPYLKKRLFVPEMAVFININEDTDPRQGVMS